MEKEQAALLANCLEKSESSSYVVRKLETVDGGLPKFHQWTNGKKVLAAFEVCRPATETRYFFLFIDWHRNDNYYLVLYTHDKKTTVAEIQNLKEIEGSRTLVWMYKPFKRDGKNDVRKAYFKQMFGSTTVEIKLPVSPVDVEGFFEQMFRLCANRVKADKIVEVFEIE